MKLTPEQESRVVQLLVEHGRDAELSFCPKCFRIEVMNHGVWGDVARKCADSMCKQYSPKPIKLDSDARLGV